MYGIVRVKRLCQIDINVTIYLLSVAHNVYCVISNNVSMVYISWGR